MNADVKSNVTRKVQHLTFIAFNFLKNSNGVQSICFIYRTIIVYEFGPKSEIAFILHPN